MGFFACLLGPRVRCSAHTGRPSPNPFFTLLYRKHPHLTFIDAGIVTELTAKDRRNFIDLFYAIATGELFPCFGIVMVSSVVGET